MRGLIELAVLVIGIPYLIRLCVRRDTVRFRLVQRRIPSGFTLCACLVLLVVLASVGK
jgi:hypothetical protein